MELKNLQQIEQATKSGQSEMLRLGTGIAFVFMILLYTGVSYAHVPGGFMLIAAAMIGGYMAVNIGANDVANNMGPAVGSRALTMFWAIIIAAIFEAAGALIAGGDVVSTIKSGIINPSMISDSRQFVWLMMAALLGGAIWLNIATAMGAPVSTTHSIVGGILGAGVAAGGMGIANWGNMGTIAASWVISPMLGGIVAALFLYVIKRTVTYQADMVAAAKKMVPLLIAFMVWAFTTYLVLKGLNQVWKVNFWIAILIGFGGGAFSLLILKPIVSRAADQIENTKAGINSLFTVPLIFSAALLSFAHGANDVANAVGPLAAINDAVLKQGIVSKADIPLWVMTVGAIGISLGLALYGPKLIRTVGTEITELDQMRAYSIAMSAAVTVIVASHLGLPVSSTHIAVGAVFGVGFLREYLKASYERMVAEIMEHHQGEDHDVVQAFLGEFKQASVDEKGSMLRELKLRHVAADFSKEERKDLKKVYRTALVKRSALNRIIAAWLITVPASALLGAMLYFMIRGMLL